MERVVVLNVKSSDISRAVAAADIGRSASGSYVLQITPVKSKKTGEQLCGIYCVSDTIQASCSFIGRVVVADYDSKKDDFVATDERLTKNVAVGMPQNFSNVISSLGATSEQLFFIVKKNEVIIKTRESRIPISVLETPPQIRKPESTKQILFEMNRESLLSKLKAINTAMPYIVSTKPKSTNLSVYVDSDGNKMMNMYGMSNYIIVNAKEKIVSANETFDEDVKNLEFVALRTDKLLRIASTVEAEKIRFEFVVNEEDGKSSVQMCIITCAGGYAYHLQPFNETITQKTHQTFEGVFETYDYKVKMLAQDVKTALDIISVTSERPKDVKAKLEVLEGASEKSVVVKDISGKNVTKIKNCAVSGEYTIPMCCRADIFCSAVNAMEYDAKKEKEVRIELGVTYIREGAPIMVITGNGNTRTIITFAVDASAEDESAEEETSEE